MVELVHEVWETRDEHNNTALPGCCLAGPHGDGFRQLLEPGARLVATFRAGSHFEALTALYRLYDWGEYTTAHAWDMEPYPADWAG